VDATARLTFFLVFVVFVVLIAAVRFLFVRAPVLRQVSTTAQPLAQVHCNFSSQ
jgi:glutamine amidotransferase PdxT